MVLFLILAGAGLELAGVGLALREVYNRRKQVRAHEARATPAYGVGFAELSGSGSLTTGAPPAKPTLEQRVEALESAVPDLRAEQEAAERRARESAERVARTMTAALENHLSQTIEGVRTLLLDVTRPTAAVWSSVVLLVVGLGLQTAANVLQVVG